MDVCYTFGIFLAINASLFFQELSYKNKKISASLARWFTRISVILKEDS